MCNNEVDHFLDSLDIRKLKEALPDLSEAILTGIALDRITGCKGLFVEITSDSMEACGIEKLHERYLTEFRYIGFTGITGCYSSVNADRNLNGFCRHCDSSGQKISF